MTAGTPQPEIHDAQGQERPVHRRSTPYGTPAAEELRALGLGAP
jgi:hypothetical protein